MSAIHASDQNFDSSVLQGSGPVLVDFWAPWCGPCRAMGPVVDEIADDVQGTARVVKVNVDEAEQAAAKFGVQSIPTFVVIDDGEVKEKFTGVVPKQRLLDALEA